MSERERKPSTSQATPAMSRVMQRLERLADESSDPPALTRLYLTAAHKTAAKLVVGWMAEAGLEARIDAVGNVVGRYEGRVAGARTLILGSHIDTVHNAGWYDGNLGVVLAIEAVADLASRGERLPFAIEVIAFGDEEGVRFPVALSGSLAVAGLFDPATLDAADHDDITLREALQAFGCNPRAVPTIARRKDDILGYLEVHIEQGPVLEAEHVPVGVVTAIAGASRMTVDVRGTAGHAGTVPMHLRQDAFAAIVEMAAAIERMARDTPDLVATIGRVEVLPGTVNVIPAEARFTIDLRSSDDAIRLAAQERLRNTIGTIAASRRVTADVNVFYQAAAAPCAPMLQEALKRAIFGEGLPVMSLPSGAGHDGLAMVHLCPIGMLFVRCAGGISHNPAESITAADADIALRVLTETLRDLAQTQS